MIASRNKQKLCNFNRGQKFCLCTLSNKNKTAKKTVFNKNQYCSNCYMLQTLMIYKGKENLNFSG
jgi:hypothetical protein